MTTGSIGPPVLCAETGGSWISGGGLALASHNPKWLRIARITDGSSMKLMIRMIPRHFGQTRGSTIPAYAGTGSDLSY